MNIVAITGTDLTYLLDHFPEDLKSSVSFRWFHNAQEAGEHLTDADALLTGGRMDQDVFEKVPKLKWVQTLSAGVDQMPLPYLTERGIKLTNARGVHTVQMSEFAISLMLQWVRKSSLLHENQQQQIWGHPAVSELYGKTVGIVGAGAIGEAIARKAKAFDMNVIGLNRSGEPNSSFDAMATGEEGLKSLLSQSDFIILLVPSTSRTQRLVTKEHLSLMKPDAFLINLARGEVIDEQALITALQEGQLAGAALDVFEQEPLPADSPLWRMNNVIVTPHIAGSSARYTERVSSIFYHNVRALLNNDNLMNVVNLSEGY